jgi:hypothetical protein
VAREGFAEGGVLGERLEGRGIEGADGDVADESEALEVVEGGENLDLGNHSTADDGDYGFGHRVLLDRRQA